jgi:hypothetical protein
MKRVLKTMILVSILSAMLGVDYVGEFPSRIVLVRPAEAIIGLPFTPLSFAGVARRTAYRTAWAASAATAAAATSAAVAGAAYAGAAAAAPPPSTTVVINNPPPAAPPASASGVPIGTVIHALPAGCVSVIVHGVNYNDCGGTFYKAAFQGNNLVYVSVANPL